MTGPEPLPQVDKKCARGSHPLGEKWHSGWDPAGPICQACWYAEVSKDDYENYLREMREQEEWLRENC